MTTLRQGPELRPIGTCTGCAHLRLVHEPKLGRGKHLACVHPSQGEGMIFGKHHAGLAATPSWCPAWSEGCARLIETLQTALASPPKEDDA